MAERPRGEEREDQGIKVVDRRHFTSEGERRPEVEDESDQPATVRPESAESGQRSRPSAEAPGGEAGFQHRPVDEPSGVDFTMLINAMAQPALLFLGEIPHPGTNEATVDLTQARLQIDMLDLLRVKCRGNLTAQEEGLLDRVLYQLRMLYVSRSGQPGS